MASRSAKGASPATAEQEVVTVDLPAPQGWMKKYTPRKAGTPKRNEIVFIAPSGEEIKTKRQLDQYLRSHPGGPSSSEFDWGTGDTPRRSSRISEIVKATETPEGEPPKKKEMKSTSKKRSRTKKETDEDEDMSPEHGDADTSDMKGNLDEVMKEVEDKEASDDKIKEDNVAPVEETKKKVKATETPEGELPKKKARKSTSKKGSRTKKGTQVDEDNAGTSDMKGNLDATMKVAEYKDISVDKTKEDDVAPVEETKDADMAPVKETMDDDMATVEETMDDDMATVEESKDDDMAPVEESKGDDMAPVEESKDDDMAPVEETKDDEGMAPVVVTKEDIAPVVETKEDAPVVETKEDDDMAPVEETKDDMAPVEEIKEEAPVPFDASGEEYSVPIEETEKEAAVSVEETENEASLEVSNVTSPVEKSSEEALFDASMHDSTVETKEDVPIEEVKEEPSADPLFPEDQKVTEQDFLDKTEPIAEGKTCTQASDYEGLEKDDDHATEEQQVKVEKSVADSDVLPQSEAEAEKSNADLSGKDAAAAPENGEANEIRKSMSSMSCEDGQHQSEAAPVNC